MSHFLTLLDKAPDPYLWIYGLCTATFSVLAWRFKERKTRIVFFNLAFIALGLSLIEAYLRRYDISSVPAFTFEKDYAGPDYLRLDTEVGPTPVPNAQVRAVQVDKFRNKVYDVRYTINSKGQRVTSAQEISNPKRCLVFFGCSFIYGEGLEDKESLPYLLGDQMGDNTKVFNFAFHGYGPHNALAQIESGRVEASLASCKGKPIHAFLGTGGFHIARVTGQERWSRKGPKYVLRNGKLSREGTFDTYGNQLLGFRLNDRLLYALEKSHLFFHLLNPLRDIDSDTYVAVIAETVRKYQALFPGSKFDLLYWTGPWESERERDKRILPGFTPLPVRVFAWSEMIPDLFAKKERFVLPDSHPSAQSNWRISKFLSNYLRKNL